MNGFALTGNDTAIINDRSLTDLADGDAITVEFSGDLSTTKSGKNGNVIYGENQQGRQARMKIRVLRGSADDKFLNGLKAQQKASFAGFVLMTGEFIKKIGSGSGKITNDTYIGSGATFAKEVGAKSNADGDSEQSVAVYELQFGNMERVLT